MRLICNRVQERSMRVRNHGVRAMCDTTNTMARIANAAYALLDTANTALWC